MSYRLLWLWWGAGGLLGINVLLFRLATSKRFRERSVAGGRNPLGALVIFPAAALATVLGVGAARDPYPWILVVLLVPLFGYSEVRRRRLLRLPAVSLSPATQRWLEAPDLGALVAHPIRSTRANMTFLANQRSLRQAEKDWERTQGLR